MTVNSNVNVDPALGDAATRRKVAREAPPQYLTGANLVLADRVVPRGALVVHRGTIVAIEPAGGPADAVEVRLDGRILMPGLIDLHSDALEGYIAPRASAMLPIPFAIAQNDRHLAAAGVTTCYHALGFAGAELGPRGNETAASIARLIDVSRAHSLIDSRIHCRYEVTEPDALPLVEVLIAEGLCDLVSVMDHSPGQGQYTAPDSYRVHLEQDRGLSQAEISALLERKEINARSSREREEHLARTAAQHRVPLASHDDDRVERVSRLRELGATITEFPITYDAARAAREVGMSVMVGAPNILRGGSHNGNLRAADLIQRELADCIASDYVPAAMLTSVFKLIDEEGLKLPAAVALVTSGPASAVGLNDRGAIEVGKRADLIAVAHIAEQPLVTHVWSSGRRIFETHGYDL